MFRGHLMVINNNMKIQKKTLSLENYDKCTKAIHILTPDDIILVHDVSFLKLSTVNNVFSTITKATPFFERGFPN